MKAVFVLQHGNQVTRTSTDSSGNPAHKEAGLAALLQ
jgi:hypothetical protein